jgi:hypothetical protein
MRVWSAFQGCCFEYAWRASAPQVPATGNVGAPVSPVMRVIVVPMSGSTIGTRVSGRGTIGTGYTATGSVSGMALDEASAVPWLGGTQRRRNATETTTDRGVRWVIGLSIVVCRFTKRSEARQLPRVMNDGPTPEGEGRGGRDTFKASAGMEPSTRIWKFWVQESFYKAKKEAELRIGTAAERGSRCVVQLLQRQTWQR